MVSHLHGGPEDEDFILAAPPALYGPLQALLTDAGAADAWASSD